MNRQFSTLSQCIRENEKEFSQATGAYTGLMNEILVAAKIISQEVNKAGLSAINILEQTDNINVQGEVQQKLDIFANSSLKNILKRSPYLCAIISEEDEKPTTIPGNITKGKYILSMDPLDGSSNIDVNVSIGTIFSISRKLSSGTEVTKDDLLQKGENLVGAGYIIYGSSTVFVYSTGNGVHGFTLDPGLGEFLLSYPNMKIPSKGTIYSVNEGNYDLWSDQQKKCVEYLRKRDKATSPPYNARYIGSLVADFHRTMLKGGIFMYPANSIAPNGKLRLLYEAIPLAYIVENAGGKASNGFQRILEIQPNEIHQRVPLFIGSKENVEMAEKFLSGERK